ncbi:MAG: sugar ABC transporter substrate-binding protein, partial [Chloroflexi bacterium]|nr:sugar ABC transporter substrate-binding protein [Chloroflexota bacterium]
MSIPLSRLRKYLWLLAPFILIAAIACGSDDDDVAPAATAPTATIAAAAATATTVPDAPADGDEGSKEIQFLFGIENSGIYTVVRDPAKARAEELGWTLLEGAANGDQQANVDALEAAVARGVAAIVVNPIGGGPLYEEAVKKAIDAGIPVFGYADSVEGQTGLIGFDHAQGGRLLGEEAARWFTEEYTGDKSTFSWATFNFDQGGPSPTARMVAFEKAFVAVTGIEKSRTAEAVSEEQGLNAAETFLQVDPGLDMIVGVNDAGALGAHQAFLDQIASTGRDPGEIFLGGIDGQTEAIELIATGGGPQGIYRASAALNMTEAGRAVVEIPIGVIERGEGGSLLLNFTIFSPNDTAAATKFFQTIAGRDPVGTGPDEAAAGSTGGSKEIQFLFGIENSGIYTVVRDPAKARAEELGWTLLEGAANGDQQANVDALE